MPSSHCVHVAVSVYTKRSLSTPSFPIQERNDSFPLAPLLNMTFLNNELHFIWNCYFILFLLLLLLWFFFFSTSYYFYLFFVFCFCFIYFLLLSSSFSSSFFSRTHHERSYDHWSQRVIHRASEIRRSHTWLLATDL